MILLYKLTSMRFLSLLIFELIGSFIFAQQTKSPYEKFGKITAEELQKKIYSVDSNANAVVLSDIGNAAVEGNSKGWFSIAFTRHRIVHILNKNGYDEANVEIPLFSNNGEEERLENVKAITYNVENGKIEETKLEKSGIFKEKRDKNWIVKKFTFPNVKEGCIVEFEYSVTSDFIWNLDPWLFQDGSCPVLWSEFNLSIPQFFSYAFLSHGYQPLYINEHKNRQENFTVMETRTTSASERFSFSAGVTDYRWVMKDVPELKQESFTSAIKNHIASIEFQLASQNYPLTPHNYRNTWPALVKELSNSDYFGKALSNNNNWLSGDVKPVIASASLEVDKARKIYEYVRDNFTCTDYSALQTDQSLKNVWKTKKGNVSEINLLLTAILRYAGLTANPVILSTKDHGYALDLYPMITSFNYVVCQVVAGGNNYYLDASHERLGFGKLLPDCYNGQARVVDEDATELNFSADSLSERKLTSLFIGNDEKGNWSGNMNQTPGYFESYHIRNQVKEKGKDEFFKKIQNEYGSDTKIKNQRIDSLTDYEEPVALHYEMEMNVGKEGIIYINPLFGERYKTNPFKSAQRYYPVEMPYTMDEIYVLTMEVPNGYVVDELPKQIIARLDENGNTFFEYRISQSGNIISLRSRIKLARTLFMPEEYETLREFFNLIVTKQAEQIVFKKKK